MRKEFKNMNLKPISTEILQKQTIVVQTVHNVFAANKLGPWHLKAILHAKNGTTPEYSAAVKNVKLYPGTGE